MNNPYGRPGLPGYTSFTYFSVANNAVKITPQAPQSPCSCSASSRSSYFTFSASLLHPYKHQSPARTRISSLPYGSTTEHPAVISVKSQPSDDQNQWETMG
ncbi:Uncharacterized protein Adt_06523 [Abeliophyllum distichum]|uniref:Uncharacterized protein n=1 Tax=Abeliophyllum distichum TaxID=126358 RepID=A0ABD1V751_9LAMI